MNVEVGGKSPLEYGWTVYRRRWLVVFCTAAALLIALVGSYLRTPMYSATATLQIRLNGVLDWGALDY